MRRKMGAATSAPSPMLLNPHRDGDIGLVGAVGEGVAGEPGVRVRLAGLGRAGLAGHRDAHAAETGAGGADGVLGDVVQAFLQGGQLVGLSGSWPAEMGWNW